MKRVFITQSPLRRDKSTGELRQVHDVTPAAKYGSIEVLVPGGPVALQTEHVINSLRQKLSDFSDDDYLLCLGDPAVISVASCLCAQANHGRYTLLIWDRMVSQYVPVKITL